MLAQRGILSRAGIMRSSTWIFVLYSWIIPQLALTVSTGNDQRISPFYFTVEPLDLTVTRDQPAIINCSISGSSSSVQWKRDGVPVIMDGRRLVLANGSLAFTKIIHSRTERPDEGVYQCSATNQIGTIVSRPAKLQIASLPPFDDEARDQRRIEGQTARFECAVPANPAASAAWYKDDRPLILDARMFVLPSGALEIGTVRPSDSGNYKCKVENSEGNKFSATGRLLVDQDPDPDAELQAPVFSSRIKSITLQRGGKATLECAAHGFPLPTISWLKNGVPVDLKASRFSLIGVSNLQIDNAQPDDAGQYKCRAENAADVVELVITFEIHEPPVFIKKPSDTYGRKDSDVTLECDIRGTPEPSIQWFKNGDVVIHSDYFQIDSGKNLRILGLVKSDAGVYQCFGTNSAGVAQATAQLLVLDADAKMPVIDNVHAPSVGVTAALTNTPSAPRSVLTNLISSRFVTLTWQAPSDTNSPVLTYSVYYKQIGSTRERVANTTAGQREATIQNLRPDTIYAFRVVAYNENGPGESSKELTARTHPEVDVPGPVSDYRVFPLSTTEIKLEWDSPLYASGSVKKYHITYYASGLSERHELDTEKKQYILTNLKPFTEYTTSVVAYNENGPGTRTSEVTVKTFSDVPSAAPENVVVEPTSANSVTIRWDLPPASAQNGEITSFKIRYRNKSTKKADVVSVEGNRRAYTITNLERGQTYLLRIAASTINGTGPPTEWISGETFRDDLDELRVPGQPASLRARPTAKNIVINWSPPNDGNVVVRGYTIGWGIGIPDVYTKIVDSKERFYSIDELEAGSEYVISLRAFNNMGDGRPIYETVTTRVPTAPSESQSMILPPVGLQAVVISDSTILLRWTDSSLPNAQLPTDNRIYTVRYSRIHGDHQKPRTIESTDLEVPIDGLRPNTQYMFEVKVSKGRTQSTWSLSVVNRTFEAAPSSAPLDLTVMGVQNNPTAVMINYSPPEHPNGLITGYVVFFTSDNSQHDRDWAVEGVVGDKLTTIIRGLSPDTRYFFKIQARNSKGYGPLSPVFIFNTPPGDPNRVYSDESQGIAPNTIYIIIACAASVAVITFVVIMVFCCRNSYCLAKSRKGNGGYKSAKKGKHGSKQSDLKPPDLWIHHQDNLELKHSAEKSPHEIVPILKHSNEYTNNINLSATLDRLQKRTNSFVDIKNNIDGRGYNDLNKFNSLSRRTQRPLMIPMDQHSLREPITSTVPVPCINNNNRAPDMMQRNIFPRQQQAPGQRLPVIESSPQHSIGSPDPSTPSTTAGYDTASSGAQILSGTDTIRSASHRNPHPLKSFSVPAPPPQVTVPPSLATPRHSAIKSHAPSLPNGNAVSPAITASPYKRSPMTVLIQSQPRSPKPPVTFNLPPEESQKLPHHYSSEELSAEMANLEGLIKDLNVLHASEFSC